MGVIVPAGSAGRTTVEGYDPKVHDPFFDGVSSEHTAYLTEPYTNPRFPGDQGRLTVPAERMRKLVLAAAERGHTVRIHVIGDGAIHAALDIFEEAAEL